MTASIAPQTTPLSQAFLDLSGALVDDFDVVEMLTSIADRCVELASASVAHVALVAPGEDLQVIARSSDAVRSLEVIEQRSGEGPIWDCAHTGAVVNEDLTNAIVRWPRFAPAALDAGYHSAHAVPLTLRGKTFGALSFLRVDGSALHDEEIVAAQALADVAIIAVIQHRAAIEDIDQQLIDALDSGVLIEQAANAVAERAGLDFEPAFQRLRNHARSSRFRLVDVAVDVMSGALPAATIGAPAPRRRRADTAVRRGIVSGSRQTTTKATLTALVRSLEEVAAMEGSDATIIALFQRGAYLTPMVGAYGALAASGATVVTACAGDAPTVPGAVHARLADDDALAATWAVIVLTPTAAGYVVGRDLDALDPCGPTLEARRQFEAVWGFDRIGAATQARWLLGELTDCLPAATADAVSAAITLVEVTPTPRAERALGRSALVLTENLMRTQRQLIEVSTRVEADTPSAQRDPVTGLFTREGLEHWLGGAALDGLAMPSMGVVIVAMGGPDPEIGDPLMRAVAASILAVTRPGDLAVHWGDAELVVLGDGLEGDELVRVAERLLAAASATVVDGASIEASAAVLTCRRRPLPIAEMAAAIAGMRRAGRTGVVTVETSLPDD